MQRTKVTQTCKKTGKLRAVQLPSGHTKMDSTVRYLGAELDDALAIAETIETQSVGAAFTGGPKLTFLPACGTEVTPIKPDIPIMSSQ